MPQILPSEYVSRINKCKTAMRQNNIDCLVLFPGVNFTYYTGHRLMRERYRITVALIDADGNLTIMGPSFEKDRLTSGPLDADVQHGCIAKWIVSKAGPKSRVGLELTTDFYHYLALKNVLQEVCFVDPIQATDYVRAIKSETEIACLEKAVYKTQERMEKVPSMLETGMTELSLARRFGPGAMIQFGCTTTQPNEAAGNQKLNADDVIVIDAGDRVEGYRSDLTRTFFVGEPTARMKEIYKITADAQQAGIEAAKPGAMARDVDIAAREVINKAGFGDYFVHRVGHGIGLGFHEIPICAGGSLDVLKPGMTFTVEPGIYLPGEFGVRLEDDILITNSGCRILSKGDAQCGMKTFL